MRCTRAQVDELVRAAGGEPQMVEGDELLAAPVTFSVIGEKASLNALNALQKRGEEALELRIPMSSFGENQRFRGASERQDRSPEYPDTAASSPNAHMMREEG